MNKGISGNGALMQRYDTTASNFVTIANVFNLKGPTKTRDTIDTTTLDSTAGYKEFIGGLRDGGEVTFSCNFTAADYDILNTDYENDTNQQYQIVLPTDADGTQATLTWYGMITNLGTVIPENDRLTCDVTIKVSGQVTMTTTP